MKVFKTSNGEIVKGKKLRQALKSVSKDLIKLAYAIKLENLYANHVTELEKEQILTNSLKIAEKIKTPENIGYEL